MATEKIEIKTSEQVASVASEIETAVRKDIAHLDDYEVVNYTNSIYATIRIYESPRTHLHCFSYVVIERVQSVVKGFAAKYRGISYGFGEFDYCDHKQPTIEIDIFRG